MKRVLLAIPVVGLLAAPVLFPTAGTLLAAGTLGYCAGVIFALVVMNGD
jgi:hypothetical protein